MSFVVANLHLLCFRLFQNQDCNFLSYLKREREKRFYPISTPNQNVSFHKSPNFPLTVNNCLILQLFHSSLFFAYKFTFLAKIIRAEGIQRQGIISRDCGRSKGIDCSLSSLDSERYLEACELKG